MPEDMNDFWATVIAAHSLPDPPDNAVTAAEFAVQVRKCVSQARIILKGYVAQGLMQCNECRSRKDGKPVMYYWPREEGKE